MPYPMIQFKSTTKKTPPPGMQKMLLASWQNVLNRPDVGFTQIPARDEDWQAIDQRLSQVQTAAETWVVGIGGSSLGTQVIAQSLARKGQGSSVRFLESPDPYTWQRLDKESDRHVVIISKSGHTLETLAWVEQLAAVDASFLNERHCTVIASPGQGPLQQWAKKNHLPCLWIPGNVGGRFSVLTAVGMFPAGLMGLKPAEFRAGSQWALGQVSLVSALSAEILQSWEREEWITQMWSYSEALSSFGGWWQQLWGESLAKKTTRDQLPAPRASTPMACAGPRDQHSLVQQLIEGARDKYVFINRVASVESGGQVFRGQLFADTAIADRSVSLGQIIGAEAEAFAHSLSEVAIPHSVLEIERIDEKTLGALFMLWQMTIAQLGEFMGIDAFNQPGVELGKVYANKILRG